MGRSTLLEEQKMTGETINDVHDNVGTWHDIQHSLLLSRAYNPSARVLRLRRKGKVLRNLRHNTSETSTLSHCYQSKCQQATSERAEFFAVPALSKSHGKDSSP